MTEYEALELAHERLMESIEKIQAVYTSDPLSVRYELLQEKAAARVIADMLRERESAPILRSN